MCYDPIVTKNSNEMAVPCGKCVQCKARRVSAWSFRLRAEERRSSSAYFITLTYDNAHAQSTLSRNGFLSLEPRHLQLYFKRLRKAHETAILGDQGECAPKAIKYYAVGEYGGKSFRPHYHIILFNAKLELIDPAWNLGRVHFGKVSAASIGYCLKYISKPSKIPMHRNDDRIPEFSRMSKGLGENYVTGNMVKWHKADLTNRMYLNIEDGKKISMPRYYKHRIYSDEERAEVSEAALLRAARTNQDRATRAIQQGKTISSGKSNAIAAQNRINAKAVKSKI